MMEPFRQRIVAMIVHTQSLYQLVYISESFFRPFCLKHSARHKDSVFPLNSSNDTLIVFHIHMRTDHDGGTGAKHTVG